MSVILQLKKQMDNFTLNINLETKSRRIGILGASGCGKSMTLKSIAGVQNLDEGFVSVDGRVLFDSEKRINEKIQKRKIGYLFQNYALFPTMTVEQNIMAGLHGKKEENYARAKEMIMKFQLQGLEKRLPSQLSGGQQQRTALARIMAYQPDMILLDEPFSALDGFLKDKLQQEMLEMLEDYSGTVILVSHNRDEIYRFSEELLIMENGHIIIQGKTKEVFSNPIKATAARLTGCKNITDITFVDDEHFTVADWGCTIEFNEGSLGENSLEGGSQKLKRPTKIGYRAHEFLPIWGEKKENCIAFHLKSMAELPFERKYFLYGENNTEICWFLQKDKWPEIDEKGLPDYLQIRREEILYLNDE